MIDIHLTYMLSSRGRKGELAGMGTVVVLVKSLVICEAEGNKPMLGGLRMIPRVT